MKHHIRVLVLVFLLVLFSPVVSSAQEAGEREAVFCSNQEQRQSKIAQDFVTRIENYRNAVDKQTENQVTRRNNLDRELAVARGEADIVRNQSYELIKEKQGSEEGKALAETYATEADAAISARRAAYDQARTTFHSTVDDLLGARDKEMGLAIANFQTNANVAMSVATGVCDSVGSDRVAGREQLIEELKNARLAYAERLRTRQDFRAGVRAAIVARNEAYKAATAEFQKTMLTLREKYSALKN